MQLDKKLSRRAITKSYIILYTTLINRINDYTILNERRLAMSKLTELEEGAIIQHILDLDTRGFTPRLAGVEDIANHILESRGAPHVGTRWAQRFIQRQLELKTRFTRVYDF